MKKPTAKPLEPTAQYAYGTDYAMAVVDLHPGEKFTFEFDFGDDGKAEILDHVLGISSFYLSFDGSDDHHVERTSCYLTGSGKSKTTIGPITANLTLSDNSNNNIDPISYVTVGVIAKIKSAGEWKVKSDQLVNCLDNQGSGGEGSVNLGTLGTSSDNSCFFLSGFDFAFSDKEDHSVSEIKIWTGGQAGTSAQLQAFMNIDSGGQEPVGLCHVNGTAIAAPGTDSLYIYKGLSLAGGTESHDHTFETPEGQSVAGVIPFITYYDMQYPDNDDHHLLTYRGGSYDLDITNLDGDKFSFKTQAVMYDDENGRVYGEVKQFDLVLVAIGK